MSIRISPDASKPSASIEIPLSNPLPDYDLEQLEQPTPRDVDAVLVSQGFRDLVDDARGVLLDLLAHPPRSAHSPENASLDFTHQPPPPLELLQLTGAICPGDDNVYRPGLWIVLRDAHAPAHEPLHHAVQERIGGDCRGSGEEIGHRLNALLDRRLLTCSLTGAGVSLLARFAALR